MGGDQSHKMVWWERWPGQEFTEDQRIAYFRRWPSHCWLAFLIEALWGVDTFDQLYKLESYFESTLALGFGSQQDYEPKLEDP